MPQELSSEAERSYLDLARRIGDALARSEAHAKATHERFNVFSTLLKESDEVRLHTRFIHCLLDPRGSHDCGSMFLDLFFETLETLGVVDGDGKQVDFERPSNCSSWIVHKEASRSPHGQIDLLLENSGCFGIAIENKIHAGEQTAQLSSYGNYLSRRYDSAFHLIYLTLDGKVGFTAEDHRYLRISYERHVLHWLEACLRETYSIIPINQVVIQYRAVVRRLTNQSLQNEFMKSVLDFVRANPDIVRHNEAIQESVRLASINAWERLKERIVETFKSEYDISFSREKDWGFKSNGSAIILKARASGGQCHFGFPVWIEPDYENDMCLSIGICTDGLDSSLLRPEVFEKVRAYMEILPRHDFFTPENGQPRYPIGWRSLIQGSYAEQCAEIMSDARIASICEDIRDYLNSLTKATSEAQGEI